jgi:hypothetical protein
VEGGSHDRFLENCKKIQKKDDKKSMSNITKNIRKLRGKFSNTQTNPRKRMRKKERLQKVKFPLSPRHAASLSCGWRKRPPDMDGSCEYI